MSIPALLLFAFPSHTFAQDSTPDEIIVTAQRREQSIDEVTTSISVYSANQLDRYGIADLADVALYTPGFTVTLSGAVDVPIYTIRGIGFVDTQPNSSASVGVYVDEVQLPYPVMTTFQQFDLARVEILKGPQSDLYGRNNTGGAINVISAKPTNDPSSDISLNIGSYDSIKITGNFNAPVTDHFQSRFAFMKDTRRDGWQVNELTGERSGQYDSYAMRSIFAIDLSGSVKLLLKAYGTQYESEPAVPQSIFVTPSSNAAASLLEGLGAYPVSTLDDFMVSDSDDPGAVRWGLPPRKNSRLKGASARLDWETGERLITYIVGYDDFDRAISLDWDGTEIRSLDTTANTEIVSFSQELRLASNFDNDLTWIFGAQSARDNLEDETYYDGSGSPTIGFTFGSSGKQKTKLLAIYGHGEWQFSPRFRFDAGLRYTSEQRGVSNCTRDSGDGRATDSPVFEACAVQQFISMREAGSP